MMRFVNINERAGLVKIRCKLEGQKKAYELQIYSYDFNRQSGIIKKMHKDIKTASLMKCVII